jgi:hypothetical protein
MLNPSLNEVSTQIEVSIPVNTTSGDSSRSHWHRLGDFLGGSN